jgi:hypothetical protein
MMAELGTDLSCVEDLDPAGAQVSGRILLAEAMARRLSTPRGGLIDDPNFGYDLTAYLNDDVGPGDLAAMSAGATAEALKDERVLSADVSVTLDPDGKLRVTMALADSDGPFTLVLAVGATTVDLLSVSP